MLKRDTTIHLVLNLYVFGVNLGPSVSENSPLGIYSFCVMFILLFISACVK